MLKELSKDYLLNFDYNVFGKRLKPKGELQDAEKNSEKDMADVMEASLGKLSGSTKTSYQPLENVKIVLKHKKAIDEEIRGSRSRNIHSIFIQRGEERFKLPENNLPIMVSVSATNVESVVDAASNPDTTNVATVANAALVTVNASPTEVRPSFKLFIGEVRTPTVFCKKLLLKNYLSF